MTATLVPAPPVHLPMVDKDGMVTPAWRSWFQAMHTRSGGTVDKVASAFTAAMAAVPITTEIVAGAGLHHGGPLAGNIAVALYRAITTVAGLPMTGNSAGDVVTP